ncbi:hypothetical protein EPUL_004422 [Erysiphe pulchra]|uniref:Tc1-like transposase DDE domain-containing protein n=1 Tax=Erysiphe pulchra TaxID=225359 RepID=A0A2S4PM37_9PEZI|nr:hypothetical protein EPUL_004422 [Erysiphe pulchra]
MQDNVPPHSAAKTMEEMGERAITPVSWPPNSPDLNPIEAVWDIWAAEKKRCQVKLRPVVKEAYDSVPSEYFDKLIETMPARCQAVKAADGGPTKY